MPGLVTATGVLGFLADEEPELKVFALQTLNDDIDTVWTEVAGALSQMYVPLLCVLAGPPDLTSFSFRAVRLSTRMSRSRSGSLPRSCSPRSTTTCRPTTRA